jgi:hypothetical protein
MSKAPMAIGVIAAGVLALAGIAYLQTDRYALTRFATVGNWAAAGVESQRFVAASRPPPSDEPVVIFESQRFVAASQPSPSDEPVVTVVTLPVTTTGASPRYLRDPAVPVAPVELVPCAPWRDLGPLWVSADGSGSAEQHRVQMLCSPGTWPPLLRPAS